MFFFDFLFAILGAVAAYFMLRMIHQEFILKHQQSIKIQAQKEYLLRQEAFQGQEGLPGAKKEKGWLFRLDRLLDEIGIRRKWSYLTAEIYLLFFFAILAVIGVFIFLLTKSVVYFLLGMFLLTLIHGTGLYLLAGYYYKKTEKQLLAFINLIDNYAQTSDDLVEIIGKTETYLEKPLKTAVSEFHWEAVHTGEIDTALRHLTLKVQHGKLKEMIRNLDICRRHEANYTEIITDIRVSVKEYLASKEERRSIQQNARASIVIIILVGILILRLVNGFIGGDLWKLLLRSKAGIAILVYLFVVLTAGIRHFIKIDKS